jgi:hypothetical protein
MIEDKRSRICQLCAGIMALSIGLPWELGSRRRLSWRTRLGRGSLGRGDSWGLRACQRAAFHLEGSDGPECGDLERDSPRVLAGMDAHRAPYVGWGYLGHHPFRAEVLVMGLFAGGLLLGLVLGVLGIGWLMGLAGRGRSW